MSRKIDQHFTVKEEFYQWSWTIGDGYLRMFAHTGDRGEAWWTGEFVETRGIATVYRQRDLTRLDFVALGRCYSRSWRRYFGDRTIARLARAFITDLQGRTNA